MYEVLIESYAAISKAYPGWSLTEIKSMSFRERLMWLKKAVDKIN